MASTHSTTQKTNFDFSPEKISVKSGNNKFSVTGFGKFKSDILVCKSDFQN